MGIKITGLEELQKKLKKISSNAEKISGTYEVAIEELLDEEFMTENTKFTDFWDFVEDGGWTAETAEDFSTIPDDDFDEYIKNNTEFESWEDMKTEAAKEYGLKKIFED